MKEGTKREVRGQMREGRTANDEKLQWNKVNIVLLARSYNPTIVSKDRVKAKKVIIENYICKCLSKLRRKKKAKVKRRV